MIIIRRAAPAFDLVAVVVFVAIGRAVHTRGESVAGLASTAWPFLVGLGLGYLVVFVVRRSPASPVAGTVVVMTTVAIGMILRVVAGQGTAIAFVFVAVGFLGASMLGWRLVIGGFRRWRLAGDNRS